MAFLQFILSTPQISVYKPLLAYALNLYLNFLEVILEFYMLIGTCHGKYATSPLMHRKINHPLFVNGNMYILLILVPLTHLQ